MEHQQNAETQKHHIKTYQFDVDVAQEYGVDESIILRHVQFWIFTNRANGKHFHDGRTWTYGSVKAFAEIWPFWSVYHISRKLNRLIRMGVLVKGNYNDSGYDRTFWYAFRDEKSWFLGRDAILQKRRMDFAKAQNGFCKSAEPIPNQSPNKSPDKSQNKGVGKTLSEKKSLGLMVGRDRALAEASNNLKEVMIRQLRPVTRKEITTQLHILAWLVHGCESGKWGIDIFQRAIGWVKEARTDGVKQGGKPLFTAIVKRETGFAAKQKNQQQAESKKTCEGGRN